MAGRAAGMPILGEVRPVRVYSIAHSLASVDGLRNGTDARERVEPHWTLQELSMADSTTRKADHLDESDANVQGETISRCSG